MKKKILLFFSLFFAVAVSAEERSAFVVELRDGSVATFFLAEKPKVTFDGEEMNVVSSTANMEFVRSKVRRCYFDGVATSVDEVVTSPKATISDNTIIINGIPESTIVTVYTANGVSVMQSTAINGACTLSLENLPGALYIVSYNNTNIKFLKK